MLEIVKLDTARRRNVDRFIRTNGRLYEGCPVWVPPIWDAACAPLNRKTHPYYLHSDADFFVAVKHGRDVGRIAVLENRRYNDLCPIWW